MAETGLQSSVLLRPWRAAGDTGGWGPEDPGLYGLVAGAHRVEAARRLGWTHIEAIVVDGTPDEMRLIEIDENLARAGLTALDRARFLAARKAVHARLNPGHRHGGDRRSARYIKQNQVPKIGTRSFLTDATAQTGLSTSMIYRAVEIGEKLDGRLAEALAGTPLADREGDLHRIARMPAGEQLELAVALRACPTPPSTLKVLLEAASGNEPGSGAAALTCSDAAATATTIHQRPGLAELLAAARDGRIDAVCAEALDRISRDQADMADIFRRLRYHGVGIVTLEEGEINAMHIGFKGVMNEAFIEALAQKTRRGQLGRVREGRIPGGLSYGYAMANRIGEDGQAVRGLREIDRAEAKVIRRIYRLYAGGLSTRKIAARLNAEGVPGPRGKDWTSVTINGHRQRRNGILNNELYRGVLVYNRQRFVRNPETGKRQARPNPPSEWTVQEVPHLRIVDDDLWEWVQTRRRARALEDRAMAGLLDWAADREDWPAVLARAAEDLTVRRDRLVILEQRAARLEIERDGLVRPPARAPKDLAARLESKLAGVAKAVANTRAARARHDALLRLRSLIARIAVTPGAGRRETVVAVEPRRDALVALALEGPRRRKAEATSRKSKTRAPKSNTRKSNGRSS